MESLDNGATERQLLQVDALCNRATTKTLIVEPEQMRSLNYFQKAYINTEQ